MAQVDFLGIQPRVTEVGETGRVIDLLHFHETTTSGRPAVLPARFPRGDVMIDGLMFRVHSVVRLFGLTHAQRGKAYPLKVGGVPVNAKFDELHLLHTAAFPEVAGRMIATVRLRYSNGRQHDFPIVYGAHCADWEFRTGYERESVSDPDTKVFWRDPESGKNRFKIHYRAWKTVLRNPNPDFHVRSMDLISGRTRSTFALYAATIAKASRQRELTPGVPFAEAKRKFDATLQIRVIDRDSGKPIAGATIAPSVQVMGVNGGGDLVATDADGRAVVRYWKDQTTRLAIQIEKNGYARRVGVFRKGIPVDQEYELTPAVPIGGRLVDATDNPIEGALVEPRLLASVAITDADGYWTSAIPDPSRYLRSIRINLPKRRPITIRTDSKLVADLVARRARIEISGE